MTVNQALATDQYPFCQVQLLPFPVADVQKATCSVKVLSKVYQYTQTGWPASVSKDLQAYKSKQDEIGLEDGCLMWEIRAIIHAKLQSAVLQSLHLGHPGITRMKAITHSYFWWTGLDQDIEKLANSCESCQAVKSSPAVAPLHPWAWPDAPWEYLHVDFACPFLGKMFLIVVDAHSKWRKSSQCPEPFHKVPLMFYIHFCLTMACLNKSCQIMVSSLPLMNSLSCS